MKTVILIAVRLHSKRLPGKALLKLGGKTLLEHLIDRMSLTKESDDLVICTSVHKDDRRIVELAKTIGIKWFAGSEDDVLDRFILAAEREGAKTVVRVTGDNPLTAPEIIDKMIRFHRKEGAEYTYTEDSPRGTRCEVLELNAMKKAHELAEDPSQTEYMSLYFRQPDFFRISKFSIHDSKLKRPHYRLTIDMPEDFKVLKIVYNALYDHREMRFPSLSRIIEFLDDNPDIVAMNQGYTPVWEFENINFKLKKSQ